MQLPQRVISLNKFAASGLVNALDYDRKVIVKISPDKTISIHVPSEFDVEDKLWLDDMGNLYLRKTATLVNPHSPNPGLNVHVAEKYTPWLKPGDLFTVQYCNNCVKLVPVPSGEKKPRSFARINGIKSASDKVHWAEGSIA